MDFLGQLVIVILISIAVAFLSIAGGLLMLSGNKLSKKLQEFGPYIAIIVILYAVFGDLVPEAMESETMTNPQLVGLIAAGFAACAVFGYIMGHFHHHNDIHAEKKDKIHGNDKQIKSKAQAMSMLVVDSVHTAADGIMLGSAFAAGIPAGIAAGLSVAVHELPQEIGDFSIMIASKMRKERIIKLEAITAAIIVPFSVLTFIIGNQFEEQLPFILTFASGFLLYIAFGEIICIVGKIREKVPKQLK